jgi:protein PhnA
MNIENKLRERSGSTCELCNGKDNLQTYNVPPVLADGDIDKCILVCQTCIEQINGTKNMDANHWRCLNNSVWSPVPAVQVMAWRLLNALRHEGWPLDLLEMLYMDDETISWAKAIIQSEDNGANEKVLHKDSNGTVLQAEDSVILIKDLDVKGGGFTAKRGTVVRGISLVEDNASQIEGRVNGQQIVILTQYVKKSS